MVSQGIAATSLRYGGTYVQCSFCIKFCA